ncbi:MAG TPA: sulfatase-like hydrolase/transferase [Acidobacteriaceae bacterium]|nr:sulfatase-like hydrolase/transferase [Acidobacteriaceae bacterium]
MKAKSFLESAGLAVLYALPIADAFFKPWHVNSFHAPEPVASIPRAILLLTLLVWALAWLVLAGVDRLSPRARTVAGIAFPTLLVWLLGRLGAGALGAHPAAVAGVLLASHIGVAAVPIVLLLLWQWRPKALQQALDGTRALFTVAAFGMIILLPKLAWQALRFEPREQTSFTNPSLPTPSSAQPRIVWILMDELSYKQVFEHPPSGLTFPHLQQFADHSTTFSDLQPTGYHTEEVIPGLFLGQPVADVEHIYGRPFRFRSVHRGPWHPFNPSQTIFGDAQRLGWTTGVAAWFNPYCRFLGSVLDRCSWQFSDVYPDLPVDLYYNRSTFRNLLALLPPHERITPVTDRPLYHQTHLRDYQGVMAQSESLLRDARVRFVFLHLPIPHPPGIYDRHRHALAAGGDYIDNLVLADNTLGQLLQVIQSTPDASQTSVIVSSDHSWRVDYWKKQFDWTPEERRASDEKFDTRPVLVVRLPGSEEGQVISRPTSAMIVHPILEALLRGQLHSSGDIAALAVQQGDKTVK